MVWAAKKANNCEGNTENEEDDTNSDAECTLQQKEKEAIRSLSLSSPLVRETVVANTSEEETFGDSMEEADSANDALVLLKVASKVAPRSKGTAAYVLQRDTGNINSSFLVI